MAGTLERFQQMQADPRFQALSPDDKEWTTRNFLAKHVAAPDMQNQQSKQHIIETVRDLHATASHVDAVSNPFEAFGRTAVNQLANDSLPGHVIHALTGNKIPDQPDFYPEGPAAQAASVAGHYAGYAADPTNFIPGGTAAKEAYTGAKGLVQVAKYGAKAGGVLAGVDSAAVQQANNGSIDAGKVVGDALQGAAVGGALGVVAPAVANRVLAKHPSLGEGSINPFHPSNMSRDELMTQKMQKAGLSQKDIAFANGTDSWEPQSAHDMQMYDAMNGNAPFTVPQPPTQAHDPAYQAWVDSLGKEPNLTDEQFWSQARAERDARQQLDPTQHFQQVDPEAARVAAVRQQFQEMGPLQTGPQPPLLSPIDNWTPPHFGATPGERPAAPPALDAKMQDVTQRRQGADTAANARDLFQQLGPLQPTGMQPPLSPIDNWVPPSAGAERNMLPPALQAKLEAFQPHTPEQQAREAILEGNQRANDPFSTDAYINAQIHQAQSPYIHTRGEGLSVPHPDTTFHETQLHGLQGSDMPPSSPAMGRPAQRGDSLHLADPGPQSFDQFAREYALDGQHNPTDPFSTDAYVHSQIRQAQSHAIFTQGEGMRPAPTAPKPEPPPATSQIKVVNDGTLAAESRATEAKVAEAPHVPEETGPLTAEESTWRKELLRSSREGSLSPVEVQKLHSFNQRIKANRGVSEVQQPLEAVKSTQPQAEAIQQATSQRQAPDVVGGANDAVGANSASDELRAKDFVANQMPNVGDKPSGEKMAVNVNVANVSTEEGVQAMTEAMVNRFRLKMEAEKRGVRSQEQSNEDALKMLATKVGMSPEKLANRMKGETYNDSQLMAAAHIVQTSYDTNVKPAFARILGDGKTPPDNSSEALLAAAKAVEMHMVWVASSYGARSEVARALNAAKKIGEVNKNSVKEIKQMLDSLGGDKKFENIANALKDADIGDANRVLRSVHEGDWSDIVNEYFINSILSGLRTQAANNVGNALNVAGKLSETLVASVIGTAKESLTGRRAVITMGELREQYYAITQGIQEGIVLAKHSAKTGDSGFDNMHAPGGAGSAGYVESRKVIPGQAGEAVRLPSRGLTVGDDFWKGVVYRMELNGLAYREAHGKGLKGDELTTEVSRLISDPTPEMLDAATKEAHYRTFVDPMDGVGFLGSEKIGAGVMHAKRGGSKVQLELAANPNKAVRAVGSALFGTSNVMFTVIIPFVKTPIKIVNYAAERSPLAVTVPEFWQDFAKGGAHQEMALAKLSVGSALAALFYSLANGAVENFGLTGNFSTDPHTASRQRQLGFQPNSVTLAGKQYSLTRFGNIGMTAAAAADLANAIKEGAGKEQQMTLVNSLLSSLWKNVGEQTFWQGASELMDALKDPKKDLPKFVANRVAAFVPASALTNSLTQAEDNVVRDTSGADIGEKIVNTVKSRIPGQAETLPPTRDLTGHIVTRDQTGLEAVLSPVKTLSEKDNHVLKEFARLEMNVAGPNKKITPIRRHPVELTPDEFRRYQELYSKELDERITRTISSDAYKTSTDDEWKKRRIGKLIDSIGDRARHHLTQEFPDIKARARQPVTNAP